MKKKRPLLLLLPAALLAAAAASIIISKYTLSVTRLELSFDALPAGFDGFRVVQLSDLHGSVFGEGNSRLLAAVAGEEPDMIALTGDFIDRGDSAVDIARLGALVRGLAALAPVYFVSGNHDWDSGRIQELAETLEENGARYLRNESVTLERSGETIVLTGVEDPNGWLDMPGPEQVVATMRARAPEDFALLLGHRASWLTLYPELDVDLVLCGHTHGGIVRLPFAGGVLGNSRELFPEYDAGVFEGGYTMIISRGLGNSIPVPRFNNIPEVISLTLRRGEG